MTIWIAFLRGINVGGKNRVSMKELETSFETAGCSDVQTQGQSGNVIFQSPRTDAVKLGRELERTLGRSLGIKARLFLLTAQSLNRSVATNPLETDDADPSRVHLAFLDSRPSASGLKELDRYRAADEVLISRGRILYLYAPSGIGRSKLVANLERVLGVRATLRNSNTLNKMLGLAESLQVR